jgi:uncharacterized repeat protein (TIGR01451 family)
MKTFLQKLTALTMVGVIALSSTGRVNAHNLDQQDTRITFDQATVALMASRAGLGQPLLQAGDEVGVILKSTPGPGTITGAGGYLTFYIPPGTQVVNAEYGMVDASGAFVPKPMKGPSIIASGNGPIGITAGTPGLIGLSLGPNIVGTTAPTVDATGIHNGTIAGVYGDTGIFYSTDPKTVWQSFANSGGYDGNIATADNVMTNNRGGAKVPTTLWDGEQLIAFGLSSPAAPIVDANGRGNAPWGMASAVAGPESGYAWAFDSTYYRTHPADANRMKNSVGLGPWQRIQYPGSQASKDVPGLKSAVLGYVGVDAATVGYALTPATPLPPTVNWTDNTSPKAVRFSYGVLELGRPEFARVKLKILAGPGQPNSPFDANGCFHMNTDAFAGDAGGDQGGKDHVWRYYNPTTTTIDTCALVQKVFSKPNVAPGETFSFQLQLINTSSVALTNVTIADALPAGLLYLSATPAPLATAPLKWIFPTVPANSMQIMTVYVKATGTGTISNTVSLTSDQENASYRDTVEIGAKALLNADKSVTPSTAAPGQTVTYTLTMTNDGTGANGAPLVITENLPAGFTCGALSSAQINGAAAAAGVVTVSSVNPAKPVFTVSQGILPGKSLVLTFTSVVGAAQPSGTYGNTVAYTYEGKTIASGSLAPVTVGGGRIGDTVFRDWNGNGVQDPTDEGLPGVTVQLYDATGTTLLQTKTTDANGAYLFTGLGAGTYVVKTSGIPAGYTQTADADGLGTLNQSTVTIAANGENLAQDFGYKPGGTGSIGDLIFKDLGNDGIFNGGDAGIPNVTVNLYEDTNGNGVIDPATDALVATTSTNASGIYSFTGLATGISYIAQVDTTDPDLVAAFTPNTFLASTPVAKAVPNLAGSVLTADFGFFPNVPSSIGDQAFLDVNGNGVYDPLTDIPVAGLTVRLYRDADGDGIADPGELVTTTTTSATGTYLFGGLGAGNYIVQVDPADTAIPAGAVGTVLSYTQTLTPGQNVLTADFPFRQMLTKSVDLSAAAPGNTLNYTITPYIPGPDLLTNAVVTDNIPTGTTFVSAGQAGVFDNTTPPGVVTWQLGSNSPPAAGVSAATGTALLPGPIFTANPDRDTYVEEDAATSNFGAVTQIISSPKTGAHRHLLVHFNTSTIPANAIIQSATLQMTSGSSRSNHTISIRNLLTDFTEGGATWNKRDGTNNWGAGAFSTSDYSGTAYGSMKANNKVNTVDVTDLVKAWQSGGTNKGIALIATGTDTGTAKWNSRENASGKPTLVVTYLVVSNVAGSGTNTVAPDAQDGYIDENKPTENYGVTGTGFTSLASTKRRNFFVKFNLAGVVPPGATISSATLGLNVRTAKTNHVDEVHRMLTAWTEGSGNGAATGDGASWGKRDGVNAWAAGNFSSADYSSTVVGTITPSTTGAKTLNVTSLVNDWVNNGVANNGIVLVTTGTDTGNAEYYTKEDGTSTRWPSLTVTWTQAVNPLPGTTTTLTTNDRVISGTSQVTVTMTTVATGNVNAVSLPTNLGVNISGTATATKVSGPSPAGPVNLAANVPQTFTWVYSVAAGTEPSDVSFSGTPTSANAPFVNAVSQSVISTPPLTFQVTVNATPGVPVVSNTANLSDDGAADITSSPPTITNLGAGIGDRVWADLNGNGVQDSGEPGIPNVTVRLFAADGTTQLATTTTDSSGLYHFTGLSAGNYVVKYDYATAPTGYLPTTPTTLTVSGLTTGQQYVLADFGLRPPPSAVAASSIGDTVWLDANNDGVVDANETLLAGATVKLYADLNGNGVSFLRPQHGQIPRAGGLRDRARGHEARERRRESHHRRLCRHAGSRPESHHRRLRLQLLGENRRHAFLRHEQERRAGRRRDRRAECDRRALRRHEWERRDRSRRAHRRGDEYERGRRVSFR